MARCAGVKVPDTGKVRPVSLVPKVRKVCLEIPVVRLGRLVRKEMTGSSVRLARSVPLEMTVSQARWVRLARRVQPEMPDPSARKAQRAILEVRKGRPARLEPREPMAQQVRLAHPAR